MFERFNEKTRRALLLARNEADQSGSRFIDSEHILFGLLRETEGKVSAILRRFQVKPEDICREIEGGRRTFEPILSSAELPLSEESKKILAYTAHEAESMHHATVGPEHLLIGILRVEDCKAMRILAEHGFDIYTVREEVLAGH
jgi:ATP-dependent Clp protease ATP-binding subunit ClpC